MNGMQWVWVWLAATGGFTIGLAWAGLRGGRCQAELDEVLDELEDLKTELAVASGRPWRAKADEFEASLEGEIIADCELSDRLAAGWPTATFRDLPPIEYEHCCMANGTAETLIGESGKACP